jgi:hypothetical protein
VVINPIIRAITRNFSGVYHPTRHSIFKNLRAMRCRHSVCGLYCLRAKPLLFAGYFLPTLSLQQSLRHTTVQRVQRYREHCSPIRDFASEFVTVTAVEVAGATRLVGLSGASGGYSLVPNNFQLFESKFLFHLISR